MSKRLIEPDPWLMEILHKIPGVQIYNEADYLNEANHFLLHAALTFFVLSLPISHWWALGSLILAILKEGVNDTGGYPHKVGASEFSNLIFRSVGALVPFVTLLWL